MNGIVWAVMDDREHYKTLKYIYTAPVHFPTYLLGRSVAFFLIGSIAVIITLVFGLVFLNVDILLSEVNWLLLIITVLVGVNMLALMGLIIAGVMLLLVHHMWDLGAAVAGSLFLFSGAIFPLEVLPPIIRWIGYLLPVTYWLELVRRSLVGLVAEAYPTFSNLDNLQLLGILVLLTLTLAVIAGISFKWCETQARERGLIDMVTNY
jgi:ABC-2 type transport system permease protein